MMPWNYKINPLKGNSEVLSRKIVEVNSSTVTDQLSEMEKRIDTKNKAFFESLQTEMRTLMVDIAKPQPS